MSEIAFAAAASTSTISGLDLIDLFAAVASIVLAIVALALSIFFFVQSKSEAERASRSAEEISASVTRLEKIFDSLYSDTFSMMRDTVTDMRQHVWRIAPGAAADEDKKVKAAEDEAQSKILAQLDRVSKNVGLTDSKISQLRSELAPVLRSVLEVQTDKAVAAVKQSDEQLESDILERIRHRPASPVAISRETGESVERVMNIIMGLGFKRQLKWPGAPSSLSSNQRVSIANRRDSEDDSST